MKKSKYNIPAFSCSEIGVVHSLGLAGIPVLVGSFFRDNPALFSRFARDKYFFSCYDKSTYIDELCAYGKLFKEKPVLYSDDDRALLLISEHRERVAKYYRFLFPEKEMVARILDKRMFGELCREKNLPAPASFDISSKADLLRVIDEIPFPCIIKPAHKENWWGDKFKTIVGQYKKAFRFDTPDALIAFYDKVLKVHPEAVVQEYVPGEDDQLYSVNMFVDQGGQLQGYFIAQKRRIYPISAGTGCYIITVKDEEIINTAMDVARRLNLVGLLNIQFKRDTRDGRPRLMEIHIRNSFWSFIGTAAGMNLSSLYYFALTGQTPDKKPQYKEEVKFFDLAKDIRAFLQYRRAGKLTLREWLHTYKGDFVIGGSLLNDPKPIIMNLLFMLRRRLSRSNNKTESRQPVPVRPNKKVSSIG